MIFLYALLIMCSVVPHQAIVMKYRLWVGGVPFSIRDFAIPLVFIFAFFSRRRSDPINPETQNFLWIVLIPWFLSILAGGTIGAVRGAPTYMLFQEFWWSAGWPVGILCGYICVRTLKNARHLVKFMALLAGIISIEVLLHFATGASLSAQTDDSSKIRTMEYAFDLAGLVAVSLVYCSAVNRGFFSRLTMLILLPASAFAVIATLTRSTTIAMLLSILVAVVVIPKELRIHAWGALAKATIWLIIATIAAVVIGGAVLGADIAGIVTERYYTSGSGDMTSGRLIGLLNELQLWANSWFIGNGIGMLRVDFARQGLEGAIGHNTYTNALAQSGIPGLLATVIPLWVAFRLGRRMMRSLDSNARAVGVLSVAMGFYMAIHGMLTGLGQRSGIILGVILGMAIKCYRFAEEPYEISDALSPSDWHTEYRLINENRLGAI